METIGSKHFLRDLQPGQIWAMQTDTVLGLCCKVADEAAMQKIIKVKGRQDNQSFVILIASIEDIDQKIPEQVSERILHKIWPGPVSVAFSDTHAYRLPQSETLRDLIRQTGPVIATSLNKTGSPTLQTLEQAREVFGDQIDHYVESGVQIGGSPSSIVRIIR